MSQSKKPLPSIPADRNLVGYTLRSEGQFPKVEWIAVLEYPDCVREFNGTKWQVVQDKRN